MPRGLLLARGTTSTGPSTQTPAQLRDERVLLAIALLCGELSGQVEEVEKWKK